MSRTLLPAAFHACATAVADGPVDVPIVVTQVPREARQKAAPESPDQLRNECFEGARVVVVSPEQPIRVLSEGFVSACDPDVSFDAKSVLFAGKRSQGERWRIYEVKLDGRDLRAISPEDQDARSPRYVSTLFTLDSPEPWFTVVYVGVERAWNEFRRPSASSLYNVRLDGSELRRITWNPNHSFDPFQRWDGRLIYAAERFQSTPGAAPRVGLFGTHIVGTDVELYGGEQGRRIQHMPCATDQGWIIFVESDEPSWDGAGQLACVHESRPHVTYQRLTADEASSYLYPSVWRDNLVLVSRRAADGSDTCGVGLFDPDQRACQPVFDSPEYHDVQARAVRPRRMPDGHSTVVKPEAETGTFYGLNCYESDDRMRPHLAPGTLKRVRFIEGVPQSATNLAPSSESRGPFVPRRLLGEAPIERDGSFNVVVPASTPVLIQALDDRGLALATCGWVWVQPNETRGCIGCHEDPELIPENEYVLALQRPSNRLTLPPDQRRTIAFREDIAPILKRHCAAAECHGDRETPLHLPLAAETPGESDLLQAYQALTAPEEKSSKDSMPRPVPGRYVDPGRARTSWLVWQLTGADTSRPWDKAATQSRKVRAMPPPGHGTPLSAEDLRTLIQWIDVGAQYQAVASNEPKTKKLADGK